MLHVLPSLLDSRLSILVFAHCFPFAVVECILLAIPWSGSLVCTGCIPASLAFWLQLRQPMGGTGRRGENWRRVGSGETCMTLVEILLALILFPGPLFHFCHGHQAPVTPSHPLCPFISRDRNGFSCSYCPRTLPSFIGSLNPALSTPL